MKLPWIGSTTKLSYNYTKAREATHEAWSASQRRQHREGCLFVFWRRNRSIVLMILAQLFSSLMAVSSKILQTSNAECHALSTAQVLITMMSITLLLSWLVMAVGEVPDAPFGQRAAWPLLSLRGVSGVFGIGGFYYSLRYLPLAEATVINFLAPMVAAGASTCLLGTHWGIKQQLAGAVSVAGVLLVSQPWKMFGEAPPNLDIERLQQAGGNATLCMNCTTLGQPIAEVSAVSSDLTPIQVVSPLQQMSAIGAALVGVMGGAAAFVAMKGIGKNTNPVIVVNYFAACTVLLSACSFVITGVDMVRLPNETEWVLLVFLGVFGLCLHMLMTASLQGENSNRALNMVYTQIVFALIMDRVVWGTSPNLVSLAGGSLILGSVIAVAMMKDGTPGEGKPAKKNIQEDEEMELMVPKDLET